MAAWLHQLTAATRGETILAGHGVRGDKAMIATLRRVPVSVPGRLIRHAGRLTLHLPPGHSLLAEVLARLRALPAASWPPARKAPTGNPGNREPGATHQGLRHAHTQSHGRKINNRPEDQLSALIAE